MQCLEQLSECKAFVTRCYGNKRDKVQLGQGACAQTTCVGHFKLVNSCSKGLEQAECHPPLSHAKGLLQHTHTHTVRIHRSSSSTYRRACRGGGLALTADAALPVLRTDPPPVEVRRRRYTGESPDPGVTGRRSGDCGGVAGEALGDRDPPRPNRRERKLRLRGSGDGGVPVEASATSSLALRYRRCWVGDDDDGGGGPPAEWVCDRARVVPRR